MRLTIVRGLPGAGKSTWAKENMSCLIVEQDMYFQRAGQYQWSGAEMKNVWWVNPPTAEHECGGASALVHHSKLRFC